MIPYKATIKENNKGQILEIEFFDQPGKICTEFDYSENRTKDIVTKDIRNMFCKTIKAINSLGFEKYNKFFGSGNERYDRTVHGELISDEYENFYPIFIPYHFLLNEDGFFTDYWCFLVDITKIEHYDLRNKYGKM